MRPLIEFLTQLRHAQVRIWAEGEQLRYRAPKGAMTADMLETLRARKAEVLAFCKESEAGTEAPPAPAPAAAEAEAPISPAQQRLWVLDRLSGPSAAYNIALALQFKGRLDLEALRLSLAALVRRHESLRTAVRAAGESAVQVVEAEPPLPLETADLGGLPPAERLDEARRRAAAEALRPFDLGRAPLVRFVLWRLDDAHWVLLMNLHHIVSDGRSLEILAEELGACYAAYTAGRRPELAELPVRYADFARRQRHWLEGAAAAAQLEFWKRCLAGLEPLLDLPLDRPRPPVATAAGAVWPQRLGSGPARALKQFAGAAGATPFMAYLAAAAALLFHYTGRKDIAIGCPATHRDGLQLERLVGFFVNTLVLRVDLSGNPSFRAILARVRSLAVEAFAHRDLPFEKVVEALGGARDLSHPPLVQFTVAMLDGRKARVSLPGLQVEPFDFGTLGARFELSLEIYEADDAPDLFWIYNTDLFDRQTVAHLARHFENLLTGALADPDCPLADLPLLDAAQRRQLLEVWGQGGPGCLSGPFVHQSFEIQAERTPDAVAVVMEGRGLSYAELNVQANRLAHRLSECGVGPGALVGIHVERSCALVVGLLAILKAGGAYVPLDPDYPTERLSFMLKDARVAVLLTERRLAGRLPESSAALILVEALDAADGGGADNPRPRLSADDPAYVIYTSASTGQPKGVAIPHRAIRNHMQWMEERFPLTAADAVLQKTPYSFDASVWEFFAPLMAGARLVMARPGVHADPAYLVRTIQDEAITVLQMVPTVLSVLVGHPGFVDCRSLRRIFVGGEVLTTDLARRAAAVGAEVCNLYGPTEATIDATYQVWQPGSTSRTVPIGRPVTGMAAYVLNDHGQPVPTGVPGELYLGGVGLALGYLHRPEQTAERFVPDPWSPDPAARLYRTGDRVRWHPDGTLEFLARLDQQVKIRGLRIEPGEIEAVLGLHPRVRQAAVLAVADAPARGPILTAYVAGEPAPEADDLRAFLRRRLPDHMVPTAFVFLPVLPMAPGGKVDRRALPAPPPVPVADPVAPRTATEAAIAGIWAGLLGLERVGVHDDFFDLGGHSLLAAQVIGQIRESFGIVLPSRLLFDSGTVAKLAQALEAAREESAAALRARLDTMDPEQIRELLRRKRSRQTPHEERPAAAEPT